MRNLLISLLDYFREVITPGGRKGNHQHVSVPGDVLCGPIIHFHCTYQRVAAFGGRRCWLVHCEENLIIRDTLGECLDILSQIHPGMPGIPLVPLSGKN